MRANVVELLPPAVELALLRMEVLAGPALHFLGKVAMHALVTAVVLRVPWAAAYDADAQGGQPDAQVCEPSASAGRDEGAAVVALKSLGQPMFPEQALELGAHLLARRCRKHRDGQYVPAEAVADREGLAAALVVRPPPALEVHRPDIVGGLGGHGRCLLDDRERPAPTPCSNDASAPQDARNRGHAGRLVPEALQEQVPQLLRTPARVPITLLEHSHHQLLGQRQWAARWPSRSLLEPCEPLLLEALHPLGTRRPTDPELPAQRRQLCPGLRRPLHKLQLQTHRPALLPGHPGRVRPVNDVLTLKVSTMS